MIWNEEMIRAELKRLDRKTGLNGAKLPIKFTHSKHTLGCFYPEKDNMRFDFSLYYLSDDSFPEEEALDLIRHEYAHFANFCLYHGTGHDRMWRKCCSEGGAVATRCYSGIFNDYFNQRKIQKEKVAKICNAYDVGSIIRHPVYGTGTVVSVSGTDTNTILEIEFYSVGTKLLTAKWVSENC